MPVARIQESLHACNLPFIGSVSVNEWYFSPTGRDSNACIMEARACQTIQAAIEKTGSAIGIIHIAAGLGEDVIVTLKLNLPTMSLSRENEGNKMRSSPILNLISCGRIIPIGFIALIFAAVVGGTSFSVGTDFNLRLVEGLVCPDDATLTHRLGAYEETDEFPSASNPLGSSSSGRAFFVSCVQSGEVVRSGNNLLVLTLATMLGGYFLACFLPLLFGSGVVLFFIRRAVNRGRAEV